MKAIVIIDDGRSDENTVWNITIWDNNEWVDGWDMSITATRDVIEKSIRSDWPDIEISWQ